MNPRTIRLALTDITLDARLQPRIAINEEKVQEYTERLAAGDAFPPVTVFYDDETYWLADGFHRYYAYRANGDTGIKASVQTGDFDAALEYSVSANAKHGIPRSRADTRRAIVSLLKTERWVGRSDNWIAEMVVCDKNTVARVREELETGCEIHNLTELVGKDGKVYPRTNGKRPEPEPEPEPDMVDEEQEKWLANRVYDGTSYAHCKYCYETHTDWEVGEDFDRLVWICGKCNHAIADDFMDVRDEPSDDFDEDSTERDDMPHIQFLPIASPPEPEPEPAPMPTGPVAPAGGFLLSEWNDLSASERAAALRMMHDRTHLRFNEQTGQDNIEWARWSWNPITGCKHNCIYCYARDIANRFYSQQFEPTFLPERLAIPYSMAVPEAGGPGYKNVFTCSMADLWGRWVPQDWIDTVLRVVTDNPQWNFLMLTKFPGRMAEQNWPANAWVGTSADTQARVPAIEKAFSNVQAGVKWLSCEPLLEPLKFSSLAMFDWIVIGAQTRSSQAPEFQPRWEWVEDLIWQARQSGCKVYLKTNVAARPREYPL